MNKTIILSELSKSIAQLTQCTEADAETFVRELFVLAAEKLQADDMVTIPGIGTFRVNDEDIAFAPDPDLAETLNAPFSAFEPIELPADYEEEPEVEQAFQPATPEEEPEPEAEAEVEQAFQPATPAPPQEPEPAPEEIIEEEVAAAITVSDRTETPRKSDCWICWVVACALCFAAGWFARGFYYPEETEQVASEIEAPEPQPEPQPEPEPEPQPESEPAPEPEPVIVYDTISANRYLTTMARAHYGQMEYWVYIYEENADKLGHPDRLEAGVTVVIPPAEKYGLKAGDEAKIREASELARQIYARFN